MSKVMDTGSLIIAIITLVLFVAALFIKGLVHDLFLESGVFLVSVKLMIMSYKSTVAMGQLDRKLDAIRAELAKTGAKA